MASKEDKYEDNVKGKFYVDTECIDYNLCRELAQITSPITKTDTLTFTNSQQNKAKQTLV